VELRANDAGGYPATRGVDTKSAPHAKHTASRKELA
jgi:hypothetical protein